MKPSNYYLCATLLLSAASSLFVACDHDDACPVQASISATIAERETRATATAWTVGDAIGVSGKSGEVDYVNVKYVATATGGTFLVDNAAGEDNSIYFNDDQPVTFTAYYPYTGAKGTAPGTVSKTITSADQVAAAQPQIDYLFASASGSTSQPAVKFPFRHSMACLVLSFAAGDGLASLSDLEYTLSNLKMEGTFNTADGVAAVKDGAANADLKVSIAQATGTTGMTSSLIVFPQQAGTLTLSVTMDGNVYSSSFDATKDGGPLKGGYYYTYNVTLSRNALVVEQASIAPWENGGTSDVDAV